jgi:uncharacterized protein YndB with AHSA1/START domain
MSDGLRDAPAAAATLVVRRRIAASAVELFAAWTQPELLRRWWGPPGAVCTAAEVDLRVGGRYRIANRFGDGTLLWITGVFEHIEPPERLVYTWSLESRAVQAERVSVRFAPLPDGATEVIVTHERIVEESARSGHERGWVGCLEGLARYLQRP